MQKFKILVLILFLLISLFGHYFYVERAYAVGADTVVRVVAGESVETVINAVAEQAGFKFSGGTITQDASGNGSSSFFDALRQSDYQYYLDKNNLEKTEMDMPNPVTTAEIEEMTRQMQQKPEPVPDRPGIGKIVLSGAAFLTGVDLLYNAYNAFQTGYQNGKAVSMIGVPSSAAGANSLLGFTVWINKYTSVREQASLTYPNGMQSGIGQSAKHDTSFAYLYTKTVDGVPHMCWAGSFVNYSDNQTRPIDGCTTAQIERQYTSDTVVKGVPKSMGIVFNPSQQLQEIMSNRSKVPSEVELWVPIKEDGYPDATTLPLLSPLNDTTTIKTPVTTVDPDPEPNPEPNPLPVPRPTPIPNPAPSPVPSPAPQPFPVPQFPEPLPDLDDPPDDDDKKRFEDFKNLATSKFPFSLPWDIGYIIMALKADPDTPEFEMIVDAEILGMKFPFDIKHDFDYLDPYMPFFRGFIVIGYCFMLILVTRQLLGGGS